VSKRRRDKKRPGRDQTPDPQPANPKGKSGNANRPRSWLATHGKDLRFLIGFGAFMLVYYVGTTFDVVENRFFPWYLESTAKVSKLVLTTCGYDNIERDGKRLKNPDGSISVERGCDAIAPTALFVTAVLASPAAFRFKWRGILVGVIILMVANVARVITLFLTRVHWYKAFDIMHLDIWQGLFILLAIFLWWRWAEWATRKKHEAEQAASNAGT